MRQCPPLPFPFSASNLLSHGLSFHEEKILIERERNGSIDTQMQVHEIENISICLYLSVSISIIPPPIPLQFVNLFGSTSLGLGYSLVFSEAVLAPAIPSVSARAGGIFLPLVKALCIACGSKAGDGTEKKLGAWLMLTCFQVRRISEPRTLKPFPCNKLSLTEGTTMQRCLPAASEGHLHLLVAARLAGVLRRLVFIT